MDAFGTPGTRLDRERRLFFVRRTYPVRGAVCSSLLPPPSVCSREVQMSAALQTNLHRNVALERVGETTADVSSSASVRAPAS